MPVTELVGGIEGFRSVESGSHPSTESGVYRKSHAAFGVGLIVAHEDQKGFILLR